MFTKTIKLRVYPTTEQTDMFRDLIITIFTNISVIIVAIVQMMTALGQ